MTYPKDFNPGIPFYENEYARSWIDQGILFFIYKADIEINLQAAKEIVADRISFQKEKEYPIFCDIRGIKSIRKTARSYLAIEGSMLTRAVSILVDPPISRVILDFYLKVDKPPVPTRVFSSKHKAIRFLKPFVLP